MVLSLGALGVRRTLGVTRGSLIRQSHVTLCDRFLGTLHLPPRAVKRGAVVRSRRAASKTSAQGRVLATAAGTFLSDVELGKVVLVFGTDVW